jgi:two-component system, chemotaxis family, chemotaxis protein CheY
MSKKVLLVGHCGADSSYMRIAVKKALGDAEILMADDSRELNDALTTKQVDLILFNRQLDYGFDSDQGVDVIRSVRLSHPNAKTMLVSNYPEAQQEALAAGALPGFGKRELGTPRVTELLRNALGIEVAK